jgi:hypothetical protein
MQDGAQGTLLIFFLVTHHIAHVFFLVHSNLNFLLVILPIPNHHTPITPFRPAQGQFSPRQVLLVTPLHEVGRKHDVSFVVNTRILGAG